MSGSRSLLMWPMPFDRARLASDGPQLCAAGALDITGDAPPEWVNIVPISNGATRDIRIDSRDGRVFVIEDADALVAASNAEIAAQRGPHPVDKDHEMSWFGGP